MKKYIIAVIILFLAIVFGAYKMLQHEKAQATQIATLSSQVKELQVANFFTVDFTEYTFPNQVKNYQEKLKELNPSK